MRDQIGGKDSIDTFHNTSPKPGWEMKSSLAVSNQLLSSVRCILPDCHNPQKPQYLWQCHMDEPWGIEMLKSQQVIDNLNWFLKK